MVVPADPRGGPVSAARRVDGDHGRAERDPPEADGRAASDDDGATAALDQASSGSDQNIADLDRMLSDEDRWAADRDQEAADRDEHAAHRDQEAADRQYAHPDQGAWVQHEHEAARRERGESRRERASAGEVRARTAGQRLRNALRRDEQALLRDLSADVRDRVAQARDDAAEARDVAAEARARHLPRSGPGESVLEELRRLRELGAATRRRAGQERQAAAQDRAAAAADRARAAADRDEAGRDELTGALRRGAGELALTHEMERARRARVPLTIAIVDVDGLKAVNDHDGHAAGDALLRAVAMAITSSLRSYDVTVRWGGDEFVCALSGVGAEVGAARVEDVRRSLEALRPGATISAGIVELAARETLESLVARADAAMYAAKGVRDT